MYSSEHANSLSRNRLSLAAITATIALALAGCSSSKPASGEHSASTPPQSAQPVELTPDMSGFLKPGSKTTCFNGGARPCAVLIRTEPNLASDYINANPSQGRVPWPLETYNGQSGDTVTVKCFDPSGQKITPYEGSSSSSDWYEVIVPEQHVANPKVKAELNQPNPSVATTQYDGQKAVIGWASVEWFNETTPNPDVARC